VKPRLAPLLTLALLALAHGAASGHADIADRIAAVSARITASPGDAELFFRRAELHRIHGDWAAAAADYDRAASIAPALEAVHLGRGHLLLDQGLPVEAAREIDLFLGKNPRDARALALRARAASKAGDASTAVVFWDAALAATSDEEPLLPDWRLARDADARAAGLPAATAPAKEIPPPAEPGGPQVAAAVLQRGPYLQSATPTSLVVRWRTDVATNSVVRYGAAPGSLGSSATDLALATNHAVTVSGLSPGTRYYYSVGSTTATIAGNDPGHTFVTPPTAGTAKAFRTWILGDSGTADANASRVRDAYLAFTGSRGTDLWLMLGDNAYPDGTDPQYQAAVFNMYPATLRTVPLWPTYGNHDGHSADSGTQSGPYYDIFTLPRNGEAGGSPSTTEAYYSFDYANVHFICLDSYESSRAPGSAMLTWLQNDLQATTRDWIVAFWHHPPYSKGSHDSDTEIELKDMRQNALPILEARGVDLVLGGHSHSYERSFLIDSHYGLSPTFGPSNVEDGGDGRPAGNGAYEKPVLGPLPHAGSVYTVAGVSGQASGGPLDHPAMAVSWNVLGSLVLDVNGNRLDATFLDDLGGIRDTFTIVKQPALLPVADFTASPVAGPAPLAVTFTDRSINGPTGWAWDVQNDGLSDATGSTAAWTYTVPGLYDVREDVTNLGGTASVTKPRLVCATGSGAMPAVAGLKIAADKASWTWTKPARAGTYDMVRGSLTALRAAAGNFASSSPVCVGPDLTSPSATDATAPSPGSALYWLVRVTECGGLNGTWADGHPSQTGSPDASLTSACP
jgi:hypothetical protein